MQSEVIADKEISCSIQPKKGQRLIEDDKISRFSHERE